MTQRRRRNRADAVPDFTREEIDRLGKEELIKRFVQEENDILAVEEQKKTDPNIVDFREQLKEMGYTHQSEIDELTARSKELKAADEDRTEIAQQKKDVEGGYKDELKRRRAVRKYVYEKLKPHYR